MLRLLPEGGTGYVRPTWSDAAKKKLANRFFGSQFGRPLDDADHRDLLDQFLWFGTDYGPGDPLRWSPVAVEILLADWIPRKIVASAGYLTKASALLRAFIRFCHAEREIRSALTEQTGNQRFGRRTGELRVKDLMSYFSPGQSSISERGYQVMRGRDPGRQCVPGSSPGSPDLVVSARRRRITSRH